MARYPLSLPERLRQEAENLADQQGVSLNQFILWAIAEKVGELRGATDDPAFPGITYRRQASGHPTPVVRGSGLRVQTIVVAAQDWDWPAEQIAAEYSLGETQVKEALAFYQAHPAEIDASLAVEAELEGKCG